MEQLTIDDISYPKSKLRKGDVCGILGVRMEVIESNQDLLLLYDLRSEKLYPLRYRDGRFCA